MKTNETKHTPGRIAAPKRYKEAVVRCYGTAESGPFAELEDGRRIYGIPGAAPELLDALEGLVADWERVHGPIPKDHEARAAIAKARGTEEGAL